MKTTATPQSRRRSMSWYENTMKEREQREAQLLANEEQLERDAKKMHEDNSQKHINVICNNVQAGYTAMVNAGKDMLQTQAELEKKEKEEEYFLATADESYAIVEIDENDIPQMRLRKIAYYILPILDCIFAWFALAPIVTSKMSSMGDFPGVVVEITGVLSSIFIGYLLSILSRMAVSSLDEDRSAMRFAKIPAIVICMAILPLMYIVSEVWFNGGKSWTYSACFAIVSFTIQLLIVTGYKNHLKAINFFRNKKKNDEARAAKEADEKAIQEEIKSLRDKIQNIIASFDRSYANFTDAFRELATARDEHIIKFGKDARYYLNQLVIYIGDLLCFRREVIPLYYDANGAVLTMTFINFPYVYGGRGIFTNNDFIYLEYMSKRGHLGISLMETIRALSKHPYPELNSSGSNEDESSDPFQPAGPNDVNTTGLHDAPSDNENPDSIESDPDNGGIW